MISTVQHHQTDTDHVADAKQAQREQVRARRRSLPTTVRRRAEEAITARLVTLAEHVPGAIAVYAATQEEVDVAAAAQAWLETGRTLALPRVVGAGVLELRAVSSLAAELQVGAFGIREPHDGCPEVPLDEVGLIVVPGVAFDVDGGRLGYGGGFYDRLLPTLPGARTVGVCFEVQLVDRVVTGPEDVPVDAVVTEDAVYR